MKVYIDGSTSMKKLSCTARAELEKLVEHGDEIQLPDKPGASALARSYLDAMGCRKIEQCKNCAIGSKGKHCIWPTYLSQKAADDLFDHLQFCPANDMGLVVSNGSTLSYECLSQVLALAASGKPVIVALTDRVAQIERFADIHALLPSRNPRARKDEEGLPEDEKRALLETAMPSHEMAGFLATQPLTKHDLLSILRDSPISLEEKHDLSGHLSIYDDPLHELADFFDKKYGSGLIDASINQDSSIPEHIRRVRICADLLTPSKFCFCVLRDELGRELKSLEVHENEFIYKKSHWDERPFLFEQHERGDGAFSSIDEAMNSLRQQMAREEWDGSELCWTSFEKWNRTQDGAWKLDGTYYAIQDRIVFFQAGSECSPCLMDDEGLLDIKTPFHVGDVLVLDCRPFAQLGYGLVLAEECDGGALGDLPRLLVRFYGSASASGADEDADPWTEFPLKKGTLLSIDSPGYSPLYHAERVKSADAIENEYDRILWEIHKWIDGDAAKAELLEKVIENAKSMTDEDLRTFLASQG